MILLHSFDISFDPKSIKIIKKPFLQKKTTFCSTHRIS